MKRKEDILNALRLDVNHQDRVDLQREYRRESTKHLIAGVGFVALSGVGFQQDGWAPGVFGLASLGSAGLSWCFQNIKSGTADLLEGKEGFNAQMVQSILSEELSDKI